MGVLSNETILRPFDALETSFSGMLLSATKSSGIII